VDHPPIAVDVHESEPYSWTMAHRAAHGRLLDHVVGYSGYVERSVLPLRRREVANDSVVVIISFGEPIDVQLSTELVADRYTSFVAGLHDGSVFTEHGGRQAGVEIRLSPLGAFRLLGVPSSELAHRVVEIDALGSRPLAELPTGWHRRRTGRLASTCSTPSSSGGRRKGPRRTRLFAGRGVSSSPRTATSR